MSPTDGPYRIIPTATARRALQKLPEAVAAACFNFIDDALAAHPHRVGKPLHRPFKGLHSANRGVYRVVYRINEADHTVEIVGIAHRASVYKPR